MTDMSFEIKEQSELEKLRAENARLKKALEFYANQKSWTTEWSVYDYSKIAVIEDDDLYNDKDDAGMFLIGGKRAREALGKGSSE